ncbi:MAG: PEP-CTERM sorting domain-containing protein [Deltaproteobacteria bacterium]|nr:PEP-CTERM sorting domain-containing protein [Deltaproteobacteria bacterium]
MIKKKLISAIAGVGLMAAAGSAAAYTFQEVQNASFEQWFTVTPTADNRLAFSVSGLLNQFDSLGFSFTSVSGLNMTGTLSSLDPRSLAATFNDARNAGYLLTQDTPYQVKIFGHTKSSIVGGEGTVTVNILNGTIVPVPEPESVAMMLAGLGLMAGVARRKVRRG